MGIFNFFKRKNKEKGKKAEIPIKKLKNGIEKKALAKKEKSFFPHKDILESVNIDGLSRSQKIAFKIFQKLPQKKQEEIFRKAMNPQEILKNKEKVLKQINEMVASGRIDKNQAERIKSQLGLR